MIIPLDSYVDLNDIKMSDLTQHLLSADKRIKVVNLFSCDVDEENPEAYIPSKESIVFGSHLLGKSRESALPMLEHEISHMVEMNDDKNLLLNDWGFRTTLRTTEGFYKALAREVRVRSIESFLIDSKYDSVNMLFLNKKWYNEKRVPFGRFSSLQDVKEWILDLSSKTKLHWNKDRIESEWIKRIDYMRDWMETE